MILKTEMPNFLEKDFYAECDEGWEYVIALCLSEVYYYIRQNDIKGVKVDTIKEKFGSLRIYLDYPVDLDEHYYYEMETIVHKYENMSSTVCEMCSEDGRRYSFHGYIKCVCNKCKKIMKKQIGIPWYTKLKPCATITYFQK